MRHCWLWWRHLAREPRRVGSILPSSHHLAAHVAHRIASFAQLGGNNHVIEIGAGTGAITRALLKTVDCDHLTVVEADFACCALLRHRFPRTKVVPGLIEEILGQVVAPCAGLVLVSSVPLFSLAEAQRARVLDAFETLIASAVRSQIVQYTYMPWLPEPRARQLCGQHVRPVWRNVPPAWVWTANHGAS